jgi:hypothetical protein
VLQIAAETVQPPNDQDIKPPTPCICDQAVQRRTTIRGSADALVDVLDRRPAARVGVSAQFLQLIFRFLVGGGDPGVDGTAHVRILP